MAIKNYTTTWMCKVFDILHGFGGLTMDAVKFINEAIRMCNFIEASAQMEF